ncbi:conserved exported hypothetical protein [Candidatus Zixiibacteriota bacterium]|nr:conserved exported hypothetical protein [candidate division Zixibacteria bacterium]
MTSIKKTIFFTLAVILILTQLAAAAVSNSNSGTRSFNFLKIEVVARPTAMGGAFTGVADDPSALYYNPAGVAGLQGRQFLVGYHNTIFDMQSGFMGYVHSLSQTRKLYFVVSYLNYGDFIRTDGQGNELGTFSGGDFLLGVGYSAVVKERFQLGGTVKFMYEKVDSYSATGIALDLGAKMKLPDRRTTLGLMVQNLGTQLSEYTSTSGKDPLPLNLRGGFSSRLKGMPILFAVDAVLPSDNDLYFCLGAEYYKLKPLYLRLGWTSFGSNYKTNSSKDDLAGFSAGFGIDYNKFQISYSISPQAELGTTHRVTLSGGLD